MSGPSNISSHSPSGKGRGRLKAGASANPVSPALPPEPNYGINTDPNNGQTYLLDSRPDTATGYASGWSIAGDPMVAIATDKYTVLYNPTFGGRYGYQHVHIAEINYKDGRGTVAIWSGGGTDGAAEDIAGRNQANADLKFALDAAETNGKLLMPPQGNSSVSSGLLMDQAEKAQQYEAAWNEKLKSEYRAAKAKLPNTVQPPAQQISPKAVRSFLGANIP